MLRAIFSLCVALILLLPLPTIAAQTEKFISFSDIHFDPFLVCETSPRTCPQLKKLRAAGYSQWEAILENNKNKIVYHQDTSYPLFKSTLIELQKIKQQENPQFVVILGDFLSHDFRRRYKRYSGDSSRAGYEAFVKKTLQFMTYEIEKIFPDIDVYPAIGNNDSYKGDYVIVPRGRFLQDTANTWSRLIKNKENQKQFRNSFPIGGYYAITLANNHNKIIVLDTVLFSARGGNSTVKQAAAKIELEWLKTQLQKASEKHQSVYLAFHIPAGIDVFATIKIFTFIHEFWHSDITREFETLLNQYSNTIVDILAGHIHMDTFQLISVKQGGRIPVIVTPSISPIFGNNPGFKLLSYNTHTLQIQNYDTYYYPLDHLNWQKEYSFNHIYQSSCHDCNLVKGMEQLVKNRRFFDDYKKYYAAGHDSQPITEKRNFFPYYWCNLHEITPSSYRICLSG